MNKTILIVDDEREIGVMLRDVIDQSVELHHVYNGSEAVTYLEEHLPDIILLDLQLPEINGLELLKIIRTKELSTIVIMITAFATVETAVEAMKIGANDFLCKPFSIEELLKKVMHYLNETSRDEGDKLTSLEDVEKHHIATILQRNQGNRRKTADELEISLRTLYYKIKQYDLE